METPKIALHYFDIQGPAEPARLALVVGGVSFEDVRYDRERMLKAKQAVKTCRPDSGRTELATCARNTLALAHGSCLGIRAKMPSLPV